MNEKPPLSHYLALEYPYTVVPDAGSYFIKFPDLPGCITQVEESDEIGAMADEIRTLWLETTYDEGMTIPEPATAGGYSGKFVVRMPKILHRDLAERAQREGVSLNAYVTYLLAERHVERAVAERKSEDAHPSVVVRSGEFTQVRRRRRDHLTVVSRIERTGSWLHQKHPG